MVDAGKCARVQQELAHPVSIRQATTVTIDSLDPAFLYPFYLSR